MTTGVLPRLVEGLVGKKVVGASLGHHSMVAYTDHDELFSWGSNPFGERGHGPVSENCEVDPTLMDATSTLFRSPYPKHLL